MTHPSLDDVRKAIRSFGDDTNKHLDVLIEVAELYLQSSQGKGVSVREIEKALYEHMNTHGYEMQAIYSRKQLAQAIVALYAKGEK